MALSLEGKFTRLSPHSPPSSCHWGIGELFHMSALSISHRNMEELRLSRAPHPAHGFSHNSVYLSPRHRGWCGSSAPPGIIKHNTPNQEF